MSLATVQDILPDWPGWAILDLSHGDQASGQGSGEMLVKQLRDPLWALHAESRTLSANQIRFWKAKLDGLDNGKKLFLGYDFASFWPANYPNGSWPTGGSFDGISATILALGGDGISMSLAGLPVGFIGSIGDMLSATYGVGSPAALALWRAVEGFTADGSGNTGTFEVRGAIPAGVANGNTVAVKKPSCHMMIVPGSIQTPKDHTARGPISFDAIQVPTP